jgi:hsp70-interacting protein
MAGGPPGLGGMTGILNWRAPSRAAFAAGTACKLQAARLQVSVARKAIADNLPRSLAHSDGTAPSRPLTAEDRKWFYEAMAVRPPSALPSRSRPPTAALTPPARQAATVDPVAQMKTLTASLAAASGSPASLEAADVDALVATLGQLQDHVEDVDCACDLSKIGGLPPLLALLRGPHARVRAAAAEVLAVCAQNNAKAQAQLLEGG